MPKTFYFPIKYIHQQHRSTCKSNKQSVGYTDTWTTPPLVVTPSVTPCKSSWGHNRVCLFLTENKTTQSQWPANMGLSDRICYCHLLLGLNRKTKESHFAVMITYHDMQIWLQKLNKGTEQTLVPNFLPKSFNNMAKPVTKLHFTN